MSKTIIEKAKRYDEVLEELKGLLECVREEKREILEEDITSIFSELKESEDENIRSFLIDFIKVCGWSEKQFPPREDVLHWLEKQGEQKLDGTFVNVDDVREDFIDEVYRILDADSTNDRANQIIDAFDSLPTVTIKQDPCKHCKMTYSTCYSFPCDEKKAFEQGKTALEAINEEKVNNANKVEPKDYSSIDPHFGKPIDEVEPKFNEGDWIVHRGTEDIYYIVAVINNRYHLKCGNNYTRQKCIDVDRSARLWDVTKDTKNGDILVYNNSIFIFNEIYKNCLIYYGIYEDNKFHDDKSYSSLILDTIDISNIHPATKEQRDLLFQKIKETGYKWDADKKELRKIEKSHTNKVGPKFKVGDWIIGKATNNEPRQISEITDQCYKSTYGGQYGFSFEDELHLWSIKDAKDGDIIYSKHNTESFEWIGIFKSLDKENKGAHFYGFWNNVTKTFKVCGNEFFVLYDDFSPATKEQRNMLMEVITKAGYEWDANELKVKKIENVQELAEKNLAWNENDDIMLHDIIDYFENRTLALPYDVFVYIPWLKSLRDKVSCTTIKEWSEEDEKKRNLLIDILNVNHSNGRFKVNPANTLNMEAMSTEELVDWLKSLKPQNTWKPSEEQMKVLDEVIKNPHLSATEYNILTEIEEQLKKLKGE